MAAAATAKRAPIYTTEYKKWSLAAQAIGVGFRMQARDLIKYSNASQCRHDYTEFNQAMQHVFTGGATAGGGAAGGADDLAVGNPTDGRE
jgi:hypothetical protein